LDKDDTHVGKPDAAKSADARGQSTTPGVELASESRAEPVVKKRPSETEQPGDSEGKPNRADAKRDASLRSAVSRHPYVSLAAGILAAVCLVAGLMWWLNARQHESTDDAFIDARTVPISSQVNGALVDVPVSDNQRVEEGALLARVDDRDYRAAV